MTKTSNFRIKMFFEERVLLDKKADRLEEFEPVFKELKKKFR